MREQIQSIISLPPTPARASKALLLQAEIADELATISIVLENKRLELEEIEARLIVEVQEATDSEGKKLYKNDAMRRAALIQAKRETPKWVELNKAITELSAEEGKMKRYISILRQLSGLIEGGRI